MSLSETFEYSSTPDGSPPSGRKRKETFRNVSFTGMRPEHIDRIDSECVQQGISRAEWIMNAFGSREGEKRFHDLFVGIRHRGYSKMWRWIDEDIKRDSPAEPSGPTQE